MDCSFTTFQTNYSKMSISVYESMRTHVPRAIAVMAEFFQLGQIFDKKGLLFLTIKLSDSWVN